MNYLTRITLGKSQAARLRISDAYAWHRKLWESFPGHDDEKNHFLFRVDDVKRDLAVLMLSRTKPVIPEWGHWETKKIAESFLRHTKYRFQIKANPTMRRSRDRRRLGLYREDMLLEWINRKAAQNGFDIEKNELVIGAPMDEFFVKNSRRGKHVAVDFKGALSVVDRDLFIDAFSNGIGSAKAFGFGMLMLRPWE